MNTYKSLGESNTRKIVHLICLSILPDCLDNQLWKQNIVKEAVPYFVQRRNRILRCRIGVAAHQLLMKIE